MYASGAWTSSAAACSGAAFQRTLQPYTSRSSGRPLPCYPGPPCCRRFLTKRRAASILCLPRVSGISLAVAFGSTPNLYPYQHPAAARPEDVPRQPPREAGHAAPFASGWLWHIPVLQRIGRYSRHPWTFTVKFRRRRLSALPCQAGSGCADISSDSSSSVQTVLHFGEDGCQLCAFNQRPHTECTLKSTSFVFEPPWPQVQG